MGRNTALWGDLKEANKTLLIIVGLLGILVVALLMAVIYLSSHRELRVELPPQTPIVAGEKEHLLLWGRFFVDLVSEISRSNYVDRMNLLLRYTHGEQEKNIKANAITLIKELETDNIYQNFFPDERSWKVTPLGKGIQRIEVEGLMRRFYGLQKREETRYVYWVDLKYKGNISLEGFGYAKR